MSSEYISEYPGILPVAQMVQRIKCFEVRSSKLALPFTCQKLQDECVRARHDTFAGEVTLCHAIESEYGPMMLRQSVKPLLPGHPDKDIGAGIHSSRSCYHMNVLRDVEKEAQSEQQAITKTTDVCRNDV